VTVDTYLVGPAPEVGNPTGWWNAELAELGRPRTW